jgi:hypothetical protein
MLSQRRESMAPQAATTAHGLASKDFKGRLAGRRVVIWTNMARFMASGAWPVPDFGPAGK